MDETPVNPVDRLGLVFAEQEIELGAGFVDAGAAELSDCSSDFSEAQVKHFKKICYPWVDSSESPPSHGCDCSHFDEHGTGCEHLWALKLLLDAETEDEVEDEEPSSSFRPRFLLLVSESVRQNACVIDLVREDGSSLVMSHETWASIDHDDVIAAIRALARGAGGWQDVRRGGGMVRPRGPWSVLVGEVPELLKSAARTGLFFWGDESGAMSGPLETDLGPRLLLHADAGPDGITGLLIGDEVHCGLSQVSAIIPGEKPGVVLRNRLHRVDCYGAHAWLRTLRTSRNLPVPDNGPWSLLDRMAEQHALPRLSVNGRPLALENVEPVPRLRYSERGQAALAEIAFVYGSTSCSPSLPGELLTGADHERQYVRRKELEHAALSLLNRLDFEADADKSDLFTGATVNGRALCRQALKNGWDVSMDGRRAVVGRTGSFSVSSGEDWFGVEGDLTAGDREFGLGQLLSAFRPGDSWVAVDDSTTLLLDDPSRDRLEDLSALAALALPDEKDLRFRNATVLLAEMVFKGAGLDVPPEVEKLRRELTERLDRVEVDSPETFVGELRPYQKQGLAWLLFLRSAGLGGCLADEMGLGKTVQILAFLESLRQDESVGAFLVVVPLSLLVNWQREAERFAPAMPVRVYHGSRRSLAGVADGEMVLTSYGVLRRDAESLSEHSWEVCVLDEAQAIKNPASLTRKAAALLSARTRIALSGTPLENRIDDLWSLFRFLNPALFVAGAALDGLSRLAADTAQKSWRNALKPLLLRRTKEIVAPDLPDLVEQTVHVAMPDSQERAYRELEKMFQGMVQRKIDGAPPAALLEGLLRLRQAACHPALLPAGSTARSGKLEYLVEQLDDAVQSGRKCLVFSQFTGFLDLIESALAERAMNHLRLDGSTRDRQSVVDAFQDEAGPPILIVSLMAGGVGLNLTAAEVVFLMDPWWNPAVESQAVARAHRIGQARRVHAVRLVSEGTLEEKIVQLQATKRALADSVINAAPEDLGALSMDDLAELLGGAT